MLAKQFLLTSIELAARVVADGAHDGPAAREEVFHFHACARRRGNRRHPLLPSRVTTSTYRYPVIRIHLQEQRLHHRAPGFGVRQGKTYATGHTFCDRVSLVLAECVSRIPIDVSSLLNSHSHDEWIARLEGQRRRRAHDVKLNTSDVLRSGSSRPRQGANQQRRNGVGVAPPRRDFSVLQRHSQ
jgi:hypothetical protein